MVKALFDTNILIDYLNGQQQAADEIALYRVRCISIISYMEVLVGANAPCTGEAIKQWLSSFKILQVDMDVVHLAVTMRKRHRLKIPNALRLATAQPIGAVWVMRNPRIFRPISPMSMSRIHCKG